MKDDTSAAARVRQGPSGVVVSTPELSAIADYRTVLQHNPHHADALFGLGVALYLAGHYAEAAEDFDKALAAPGDAMLSIGSAGPVADAAADSRYRLVWRYFARRLPPAESGSARRARVLRKSRRRVPWSSPRTDRCRR